MTEYNSFSKSLGFAIAGVRSAFHQRNFRIQSMAFLVMCIAAIWMKCDPKEWALLLLSSGLVLSLEMMNTALEKMCDFISKERNPLIKIIKDTAAGAVLIVSFFSLIIGCIILLPKLITKLSLYL